MLTAIGSTLCNSSVFIFSALSVLFEEIAVAGTTIGLLVFGLWIYLLKVANMDVDMARGYVVALMVIIQNIHAFNARSEKKSAFSVPLKSNKIFLYGVLGSLLLGIIVMEFEPLAVLLKTTSIPPLHLLNLFALGFVILIVMECYKKIKYGNK